MAEPKIKLDLTPLEAEAVASFLAQADDLPDADLSAIVGEAPMPAAFRRAKRKVEQVVWGDD